jgi:uncharacterized surface protein with fasciclin (FAS1) repeats
LISRSILALGAALALSTPLTAAAQTPDAQAPAAAAPAATAPAAPSPNLAPAGDMVATLRANPNFSILVKALDAANLSAVLAGTPQLTLFAPTDAAFQALPPGLLTALTNPANLPTLQRILTYHLVHLDLDADKIKGAKGPVTSVEGQTLQIDGFGPTAMVNDAHILQVGVHATNGWLYPIDKVVVPPDVTLPH